MVYGAVEINQFALVCGLSESSGRCMHDRYQPEVPLAWPPWICLLQSSARPGQYRSSHVPRVPTVQPELARALLRGARSAIAIWSQWDKNPINYNLFITLVLFLAFAGRTACSGPNQANHHMQSKHEWIRLTGRGSSGPSSPSSSSMYVCVCAGRLKGIAHV